MQPARTLDQIVSEIRGVYDPQINTLKQKQSLLPQMIASEEKGLGAKQEQAFGDILGGARRRGLGFSGIPVGEQAKYTATEYLPALARLRQSGQEQAMTLEEAILGIGERMQNQALGMRQYEQQRYDTYQQNQQALAEQRRAAAAQSSMLGGLYGGGGSTGEGAAAGMSRKKDGGYAFTDPSGKAISAAQFARITGQSFRSLLQEMASAGDKGARYALGFVGDDFGYDPTKMLTPQNVNLYNSLTWGIGAPTPQIYQIPGKKKSTTPGSVFSGSKTIGGQPFRLGR